MPKKPNKAAKKISKPVPLGGVKKPATSVSAKRTGGLAKRKSVGNASTPGFAYGRKTI